MIHRENKAKEGYLAGIWQKIKMACSANRRLPVKSIMALVLVTALITPYFPYTNALATFDDGTETAVHQNPTENKEENLTGNSGDQDNEPEETDAGDSGAGDNEPEETGAGDSDTGDSETEETGAGGSDTGDNELEETDTGDSDTEENETEGDETGKDDIEENSDKQEEPDDIETPGDEPAQELASTSVSFAPFSSTNPAAIMLDNTKCVLTNYKFNLNIHIDWDDSTPDFRDNVDITSLLKVYGGETNLTPVSITKSDTSTYTISGIPVYITEGTDGSGGELATYTTPDDFYTVQLANNSVNGYTIAPDKVTVELEIDTNELQWTASAPAFTCELVDLTNAQFTIEWTDNSDKAKFRPDEGAFIGLVKLYYLDTDTGVYVEITAQNCGALGFLSDTAPTPTITDSSSTNWSLEFTNLPKRLTGVNATESPAGSTQYFIKIDDTAPYLADYLLKYPNDGDYAPAGEIVTNTYAGPIKGAVQWFDAVNTGSNPDPDPRPEFNADNVPINLVVSRIDSEGSSPTIVPETDYQLEWVENGDKWNYAITGMPTYEAGGGGQYSYYVTVGGNKIDVASGFETDGSGGADVYYGVTYDNNKISAEKDKCYDGGTILAVLKADAVFTVRKLWVDGNTSADITKRQALIDQGIYLYLWRYPSNKTQASAAAVTVNGTQLSYQFQAGDSNNFSITAGTFTTGKLPHYDEQGYEYTYFVTEAMPDNSGYRQAYGSALNNHFTENDHSASATRQLRNIHSEPVRVATKKLWNTPGEIAYIGTTVVLELQAWNGSAWVKVATKEISGFGASVKEKSDVFPEVEKYDNDGNPNTFRVVETAIKKGASTTAISWSAADAIDSTYSATYTLDGKPYKATSTLIKGTGGADDIWQVTNDLDYPTYYTISKKWAGGTQGNITIQLKQNGNAYATVQVTGANYTITFADGTTPINGTITVADDTWTFSTLTLPTYDAYGAAYEYTIAETASPSGFYPTYDYTRDKNDTNNRYDATGTVTNHDTTGSDGPYTGINITKEWNDNHDLDSRKPVAVHVVKVDASGTIIEDMAGTSSEPAKYPYTATLTYESGWYGHIRINPADFASGETWAVIEAAVGTWTGTATDDKYQSGEIKDSSDVVKYTYAIENNGGNFKITNTHNVSGTVAITVKKTWQDSSNSQGLRKNALRVQVYQNGAAMVGAAYTHTWNTTDYLAEATINAYPPHTFVNLDMFDEHGVPYVYTVKEFIVDNSKPEPIEIALTDTAETAARKGTNYVVSMTEEITSDTTNPDGSLKRETTISFTNTAAAQSTGTEFFVVWRDEYNMPHRPDAVYTLYYKNGGQIVPYPYTSQIKKVTTSAEKAADTGLENPYYQIKSVSGMDLFDENGTLIEYYLAQSITNNELYKSAYYESNTLGIEKSKEVLDNANPPQPTGIHHYKPKTGAVEIDIKNDEGTPTINLIPVGGAFVNTLQDTLNIKGDKVWKDVSAGITPVELPDALIYLWRASKYDDEHKYSADSLKKGDLGETGLSEKKDSYQFDDKEEPPTLLEYDKYDEYGALYHYSLTEDIMYPDWTDIYAHPLPRSIMTNNISTLTLQNVYQTGTNKRTITVSKAWSGGTVDAEPAAIFRLYRGEYKPNFVNDLPVAQPVDDIDEMPQIFETSEDATKATETPGGSGVYLVDEKTLLYKDGVTDGQASITWSNMPIFAPNGMSYVYFVCEVIDYVPGYKVTATADAQGGHVINDTCTDDVNGDKELQVIVIGNEGVSVTDSVIDVPDVTVGFTNTYTTTTIAEITGKKDWVDAPNTDLRPNVGGGGLCPDIVLTLKRFAKDQSGQTNKYEHTYGTGEIAVTWVEGNTDADPWTYTIEPANGATFPLYAENGNPYEYTVTESYRDGSVLYKNYKITANNPSKLATAATDIATVKTLEMSTHLKNELRGHIAVKKSWSDGYNEYDIRELNVTVKLQRKLLTESDPDSTANTNWNDVANTTALTLSKATSWSSTGWSNLPLTDATGNNVYAYRVVETKIGEDTLNLNDLIWKANAVSTGVGAWVSQNANYTIIHSSNLTLPAAPATSTLTAQIKNDLTNITSLTVTKTWENDDGNKYGARPTSITLMLESKLTIEGDNAWQILTHTGTTTPVEKTITAANNTVSGNPNQWLITFGNLPKEDTSGKLIQYRAVELDGTAALDTTTDSGKSLLDSYDMTASVDTYADSKSTTDITNTLVAHKNILVQKKWNDTAPHTGHVVVGLFSDNFTVGTSGKKVDEQILTSENNYQFTWDYLPKYNANQEVIEYYVKEISVDGKLVNEHVVRNAIAGNTSDNKYHVNYYVGDTLIAEGAKAVVPNDAADATTVTIVNTPLTKAEAEKIWVDAHNKFGHRPAHLVLTLQRKLGNGEFADVTYNDITVTTGLTATIMTDPVTVTLSGAADTWTHNPVAHLPAFALAKDGGEAYSYQFVEHTVPDAYTMAPEVDGTKTTITNTLNMSATSYEVKKAWVDNNNQDGFRPASITVALLHEATAGAGYAPYSPAITATLDESNSWTWELGNLPATGSYKIEETGVPTEYTSAITPSGTFAPGTADETATITVTNTHEPVRITHQIEKIWIGDDAIMEEVRPAIDMTLYRTYEGLNEPEKVTQNQDGATITNPVTFEDGVHAQNPLQGTPSDAGVTSHNHTKYDYTWSDLPQYVNGKKITYSVKESAHDGYVLSAYEQETLDVFEDGAGNYTTTITNTVAPITMSGTKTWEDDSNRFGTRPNDLTLTVYYDHNNGAGTPDWRVYTGATVDWDKHDDNTWTYTVSGLEKYANAVLDLMIYAVKETVPAYYTQTSPAGEYVTGTREQPFDNIINANLTNTLKTATLAVSKTKDRGPDFAEFEFKVYLSKTAITDVNTATLYKGGYKVFGISDDISGTPISQGTTDSDGIITIKAPQKFVIENIPDGYFYQIVEGAHADYDLATAPAAMQGTVSASPVTTVAVHNTAKTFSNSVLEIVNDTENPTTNPADTRPVGGKVVVASTNPKDDGSESESDGTDETQVAWLPDTYWTIDKTVKITYRPFGSNGKYSSFTITDFSAPASGAKRLSEFTIEPAATKDELLATYPDAYVAMGTGGVVILVLSLDANDMPISTQIDVSFTPTLAVSNITPSNQGGMVNVKSGTPSPSSDGVPEDGKQPYSDTTVVGTASTGYKLDLSKVQVRNLGDPNGDMGDPVTLNLTPNTRLRGTASYAFNQTMDTVVNGSAATVPISGKVTVTTDAAGHVTAAEFSIPNGLPVPLQFDLLFVKIPATTDPTGGGGTGGSSHHRNGGGLTPAATDTDPLAAPVSPTDAPEDKNPDNSTRKASPQTSDDAPVSLVVALAVLSGIGALLSRKKSGEKTT